MAKRNRTFDNRLNASAGEKADFDEETKRLKNAVIELKKQNLNKKLSDFGKSVDDPELENLTEKARKKRKNGEMKLLLKAYLNNDQLPDITHSLYVEFMDNIGAEMPAPPGHRNPGLNTPK